MPAMIFRPFWQFPLALGRMLPGSPIILISTLRFYLTLSTLYEAVYDGDGTTIELAKVCYNHHDELQDFPCFRISHKVFSGYFQL